MRVYNGERVLRYDRGRKKYYYQEFSLKKGEVHLERLNAGAAVLDTHQKSKLANQLGVTEKAWIENGSIWVESRFSERAEVEPYFKDMKDGIIKNLSMGADIEKNILLKERHNNLAIYRAISWGPQEISCTPVPAITNAQIQLSYTDKGNEMEEETQQHPSVEELRKIERNRIKLIDDLCATHKLSSEFRTGVIDSELDEQGIRNEVLSKLSKNSAQSRIDTRGSTDYDSKEEKRKFMGLAIEHRIGVTEDLHEGAKKYRHKRLVELASEFVDNSTHETPQRIVELAMHSTSDFPAVLGNIAKTKLLKSRDLEVKNQPYWNLVETEEATDTKEMKWVRMGEMPDLVPQEEHEEVKYDSLSEEEGGYAVGKFSRAIGISDRMIINDDLGAFKIIGKWGRAIARLETKMFYEQLLDPKGKIFNRELGTIPKDGKAIPLNTKSLGLARKMLAKRQGLDKRDGDYLNLTAKYLIVGLDNLEIAEQLMSQRVLADEPSKINTFVGKYEIICLPDLPDNYWAVWADKNQIDGITFAYLYGNRNPDISWKTNWETDAIAVKAKMWMGATTKDYRGFFKGGW